MGQCRINIKGVHWDSAPMDPGLLGHCPSGPLQYLFACGPIMIPNTTIMIKCGEAYTHVVQTDLISYSQTDP